MHTSIGTGHIDLKLGRDLFHTASDPQTSLGASDMIETDVTATAATPHFIYFLRQVWAVYRSPSVHCNQCATIHGGRWGLHQHYSP